MQRNLKAQNHDSPDTGRSNQMRRILNFYVDGLKEDKRFDCLQTNGFIDAVRNSANFDEFLANIDRAAKDQNYRRTSKEYKAVSSLKKEWRDEIETIQKCIDCYEYWMMNEINPDYFTLVCTQPHLLVYVKEAEEEGPRMWPAKVLSVDQRHKTVTIECFGDYLRADYPFDGCILFSNALESDRAKANAKYAKDANIEKQEEYKLSFPQVQKYIKNIKDKFGSFVPAATKQVISDFNQHLVDMYPRAFGQSPVSTDFVELQAIPAGNKSAMRMTSPLSSQGYNSLDGSVQDSDDISDSDDNDRNPPERPSTSIEMPPVDIKIDQVIESYCEFEPDDPNNESQASTEAENGDSFTGEEAHDGLKVETENSQEENQKRKKANTAVMKKRTHRATKNVPSASEFGHSSQANDDVMIIDDDDEDDTETMSLSSRNSNEPAANTGKKALLDEFADVKIRISEHEKELKKLKEAELTIQAKLLNSMK